MGSDEKPRNKAEEMKGTAKEKAGEATGNEEWQSKGKTEKAKGGLKQAGEKIKDAFGRNRHS